MNNLVNPVIEPKNSSKSPIISNSDHVTVEYKDITVTINISILGDSDGMMKLLRQDDVNKINQVIMDAISSQETTQQIDNAAPNNNGDDSINAEPEEAEGKKKQNPINPETEEGKLILKKCREAITKKLYDDGKLTKGSDIMAKSIIAGCKGDYALTKSIKEFVTGEKNTPQIPAKEKFCIFLSAVTAKKDSPEYSIEYKAALRIRDFYEENGIGVFWWDDEKIKKNNWNISTKIAMGLGFSSVFVALAFDSVTAENGSNENVGNGEGNGIKYTYNCLLPETNPHSYKTPNFFKYEVETYASFLGRNGRRRAKRFAKGVCNSDEYLPENRDFYFFTYGNPQEAPTAFNDYKSLNNREICCVNCDGGSEDQKIEAIVNSVTEKLQNNQHIMRILAKNNELTDDPGAGLFVTDKHTPSDYFFEYAVIDSETGEPANDKFTFFLEEVYDNNGSKHMNVCAVIKDWNYAFIESENLRREALANKIVLLTANDKKVLKEYTLTDYRNVQFVYAQGSTDVASIDPKSHKNRMNYQAYTDNGCKLTLCDNGIATGATGMLKFGGHRDNEAPKTYSFAVNFLKKVILRYTIKVTDKNINVVFLDSIPSTMDLQIAYSQNGIPCLSSNNIFDKTYSIHSYNQNYSFENMPLVSKSGTVSLRLRLCNTKDDRFFVLKCENEPENKPKESSRLSERDLLCPYCGEKLHVNAQNNKSGECLCNGEKDLKEIENVSKSKRQYRTRCSKCVVEDHRLILPEEYENSKSIKVATLGTSGAGKSVFISRLFGVKPDGYDCSVDYTSKSLKSFGKKIGFYKPNVYNKIDTYTPLLDSRCWMDSINKQLKTYAINKYIGMAARTANNDETNEMLSHMPLMLSVKATKAETGDIITFYDVAGGRLSDLVKDKKLSITDVSSGKANCLIVLINNNNFINLDNASQSESENISGATKILEIIINQYRYLELSINTLALAVVLCKFDKFEEAFDINSTVRISAPSGEEKYSGSSLEKHINACSYEIESYISQLNNDMASQFLQKVSEIPHHKFFAVSAIGRSDSITGDIDATIPVYLTEPRGIDRVVTWLAYQAGIID